MATVLSEKDASWMLNYINENKHNPIAIDARERGRKILEQLAINSTECVSKCDTSKTEFIEIE